ncbi:MAG: hypothetical protein HY858_07755 [Candidatus Solibacter usitatus]|nr:hypothetical protein [Candidatus Solibacter usitatus]
MTLAAVCASAATYSLTLYQPATVAGKELKAGDYKLSIEDGKAVIKKGKEMVEAPVKVENGSDKFSATSVRYSDEGGKSVVKEIRLGGTSTKVIFN